MGKRALICATCHNPIERKRGYRYDPINNHYFHYKCTPLLNVAKGTGFYSGDALAKAFGNMPPPKDQPARAPKHIPKEVRHPKPRPVLDC